MEQYSGQVPPYACAAVAWMHCDFLFNFTTDGDHPRNSHLQNLCPLMPTLGKSWHRRPSHAGEILFAETPTFRGTSWHSSLASIPFLQSSQGNATNACLHPQNGGSPFFTFSRGLDAANKPLWADGQLSYTGKPLSPD